MKKYNKLALSLLLSVAVLGSVALVTADAPVAKKATSTATKTDLNTVVDVQGTVASKEVKTLYMDLFGSMRDSKAGIEASAKLELKREELTKDIEVVRAKHDTVMRELQAKAKTMNNVALAKEQKKVAEIEHTYKIKMEDAEEEMKLVMQQVTEVLAKEVELAVGELAQKEGLDAVVDKVTGRVVYTSGKADCTNRVVKLMDKHHAYQLANNEKTAASTVTIASNKKTNAVA
ncbi:MAG: OmpH family outer membrane protein [Candidatus Babeliales bacterium]|nr:OmpH family outer membrane protein [Candidatus Babeliales bacterium]